MTRFIGDVAISTIQDVNFSISEEENEVDLINKDKNIISLGSEDILQIEISFTLTQENHPQNLTVEKQENQVKSLASNSIISNTFRYNEIEGLISVQSVNIPEESTSDTIREGSLSGLFLSWPEHYENTQILSEGDYGYGVYGVGDYSATVDSGYGSIYGDEYGDGGYGDGYGDAYGG